MPNLARPIAALPPLDDQEIGELLVVGRQHHRDEGDLVLAQGEPGDALFILLSGAVRVELERQEPLLLQERHDFFGERSFLQPGYREPASVRALKPSVLTTLDQQALNALASASPGVLAKLLHRLSRALVESQSSLLADLRSLQQALHRSYEDLRLLRRALAAEETLARTDPLTELYNRRVLTDQLASTLEDRRVAPGTAALVMVDLDRFKEINDRFGHTRGDTVLIRVARVIREQVRSSDLPCRYGGDEFAIIFRGLRKGQLSARLEELRGHIADLGPCHPDAPAVTVSIGAALSREGDTPTDLIDRADACLYRAKREGRDRCLIAD
jgi:diguanylate cyclase (GGDEF)-like protein